VLVTRGVGFVIATTVMVMVTFFGGRLRRGDVGFSSEGRGREEAGKNII
jgi:hypothetical protein